MGTQAIAVVQPTAKIVDKSTYTMKEPVCVPIVRDMKPRRTDEGTVWQLRVC
jgi:hypothetical protein